MRIRPTNILRTQKSALAGAGTINQPSSGDPTTLPLLHASHITYDGAHPFSTGAVDYGYGGNSLALTNNDTQIYCGADVNNRGLGLLNLPTNIASACTNAIAPVSMASANIPGSFGNLLGGALVWNNRLLLQALQSYTDDPSGNNVCTLNLNLTGQTAYRRVANLPGDASYAGGYMGVIPTEWRTLFGGPAFIGGGTQSRIQQCPAGCTFFVFNPDDVGVTTPVPSIPLQYYQYPDRQLVPNASGDTKPAQNDIWTRSDFPNAGMVFVDGTRTILYLMKHGYGVPEYKAGHDPCDPDDAGDQAYPYRLQVLFFDALDHLKVKAGLISPWAIQPYEWAILPGGGQGQCPALPYGGVAWKASTRKMYVAYRWGGGTPSLRRFSIALP